jgi:hypothetical protein
VPTKTSSESWSAAILTTAVLDGHAIARIDPHLDRARSLREIVVTDFFPS